MWSWLKRSLFANTAPAGAGALARAGSPETAWAAPPHAPGAPRPHPHPSQASAVAEAAHVADLAAVTPGQGPRRPLVGRDGRVAGFELRLSAAAERFLSARADSPGAVMHQLGLLTAAAGTVASGRVALVRLPASMLAQVPVFDAVAAGTWLQIDDLARVPPDVAAALRRRGVRLGVAEGLPPSAPSPDFVVMTAAPGAVDALLVAARRWHEARPPVAVVGLGFEQVEDLEAALRGALTLAGGHIGRSREAVVPRPLGAAAQRISELMNHLAQDRDTAVVSAAVRGDATLTYRLLRYANSAAVGPRQAVESVDSAVALLGRKALQRWLSVQWMLAAGGTRASARALEALALFRGRVLEDLAGRLGEARAGTHFTLGLLSVIEPLLQVPLKEALAPLRLGDEATAALLRREGPWASRLALLDALDAADLAGAESLACGLGLPEGSLPGIVDDAWAWCGQVQAGA